MGLAQINSRTIQNNSLCQWVSGFIPMLLYEAFTALLNLHVSGVETAHSLTLQMKIN